VRIFINLKSEAQRLVNEPVALVWAFAVFCVKTAGAISGLI